MKVLTYECDETASETAEDSSEALALIEQLGLTGQTSLISKEQIRIPYREMTAEEGFIFGELCPVSTALESYRSSPIPLRVLQVAAHAKGLGMFDELIVMHPQTDFDRDPVLVGLIGGKYYESKTKHFILARWGEALDEGPALIRAAMDKWRNRVISAFKTIELKIKQDAAIAESMDLSNAMQVGRSAPAYYGL